MCQIMYYISATIGVISIDFSPSDITQNKKKYIFPFDVTAQNNINFLPQCDGSDLMQFSVGKAVSRRKTLSSWYQREVYLSVLASDIEISRVIVSPLDDQKNLVYNLEIRMALFTWCKKPNPRVFTVIRTVYSK